MITLGPVKSSERPNLRFSEGTLQGLRGTDPLAQSLANSVNGLFGGNQRQGKSAAQKKIEAIQSIDTLVASGYISEKQGQKLKSEVINH